MSPPPESATPTASAFIEQQRAFVGPHHLSRILGQKPPMNQRANKKLFISVYTIEDNADLAQKLVNKSMPTKEYVMLDIGGGYRKYCNISASKQLKSRTRMSKCEKMMCWQYNSRCNRTIPVDHEDDCMEFMLVEFF